MFINNSIYAYKNPLRHWVKRLGIKHLVVHHSAAVFNGRSNHERLTAFMNTHISRGWPGLSYHYAITRDGTIYQLNEENDLTWTDSHNTGSLAILVDGNFEVEEPSQEQLTSLQWLTWSLRHKHQLNHVDWLVAHKDISRIYNVASTACCGVKLYQHVINLKNNIPNMIDNLINQINKNPSLNQDDKMALIGAVQRGDIPYLLNDTLQVRGWLIASSKDNKQIKDIINIKSSDTAKLQTENSSLRSKIRQLEEVVKDLEDQLDDVINFQDDMDDMIKINPAEIPKKTSTEETPPVKPIEIDGVTEDEETQSSKEKFSVEKFWIGLSKTGALNGILGTAVTAGTAFLISKIPELAQFQNEIVTVLLAITGVSTASNAVRNVRK